MTDRLFVVLAVALTALALGAGAGRAIPGTSRAAGNGEWIAYATAPAGDDHPWWSGSSVFVTQVDGRAKLVAGKGSHHRAWNFCPTFSPNGRLLAFAHSGARSTIVVVRITSRGPMRAGRVVLHVPNGATRCPRWSTNSSRLGYLDNGKVVIRGLDGSRKHRVKGDPTKGDFDTSRAEIASPTGELTARLASSGIIISRPDGTTQESIPDHLGGYPSYAIGGWSPDGRDLLLMKDVGGGFEMRSVSVHPPFASTIIAARVRVNSARSWPGYGDVSWQPAP